MTEFRGPVASDGLTIASTPRSFDRASNEWKEGETLFLRCSIWRQAAEHVSESAGRLVSGDSESVSSSAA